LRRIGLVAINRIVQIFRQPRPVAALVSLCLAAFLPGFMTIPPVDRDEPSFAEATREMLNSHDYIRIKFQDRLFSHKPIGIHWLQALAAVAVGEHTDNPIWTYRLPSLIGAVLAVLATFGTGCLFFHPGVALLGAALLSVSVLLAVEARLATTDATLLLFVVIAQAGLARLYLVDGASAPSRRAALVFWSAVGFGIMLKGPVIAAVCGLTILALILTDRETSWLRPLRSSIGIGLALLIVLPWMITVGLATSGRFFTEAIGEDMLPTLLSGFEGHGAPPGYHAALFPVMFWPGSLLALLAVPWTWRHRGDASVRFCVAWIVPTWLMFELMPTKLPHYVLPTYPAIALLAARAASEMPTPFASPPGKVALLAWATASLVVSAGVALFPIMVDGRVDPLAMVTAAAVMIFAAVVIRLTARGKGRVVVVLGAFLIYWPVFHGILPGSDSMWLGWKAAQAVRAYAAHMDHRGPIVAAAGFREPSFVFLLGPATIITDGRGAADHLSRHHAGLALIDMRLREVFHARLKAGGINARLLGEVDGLNYSTGARQSLGVYVKE